MKVPILSLTKQYQKLKKDIDRAVISVLESGQYIMGTQVKLFEESLARYCGVKRALGVANGTDALHLALRALNIGKGDEVITTPMTFVATTESIGLVGATPVFVDIDTETFNLDVNQIEEKITSNTKAIMPVHLYGQACEMDKIKKIAEKYNLRIIEDCAQAIGSTFNGQKVGSFGDIGCVSFFPSKNLGCFGDGGAILTNNEELADKIIALRNHGGATKYYHDYIGLNSRLDELQAAILNIKINYIDEWNQSRRKLALRYNEILSSEEGIITPKEHAQSVAVYHQYTIRVSDRDKIQAKMAEAGVMTMIYYPIPLHLQKVHAHLGIQEGAFPNTEKAANEVLSLPMFPELSFEEQDFVVEQLKAILRKKSSVY